jgi:hypothetical protein
MVDSRAPTRMRGAMRPGRADDFMAGANWQGAPNNLVDLSELECWRLAKAALVVEMRHRRGLILLNGLDGTQSSTRLAPECSTNGQPRNREK